MWHPAPLQNSVHSTLPRTWGNGAWAGSFAVVDWVWVPPSHEDWTHCCSWCFLPPILSFSKGLAREGKTQGSWVSLQVWAFLKSGEKNSSALEYYHPVPFSSLGTLAMPPLVYILFQGKERPASVWQMRGHNPCTVSLLTPGLCMDWVDADKLFLCAPTHQLILQTF